MEAYPEFYAAELPVASKAMAQHSVIGYDFVGNRFYRPRRSAKPPASAKLTMPEMTPVSVPAQPEAPASVATPPTLTTSEEPGAITLSMKQQFEMVTTQVPVEFACAEE